jgi:enoyl-[acyl-carrier protein] reductase I
VTKDDDLEALQQSLLGLKRPLHAVVHSLAFANREDLSRPFLQTSRSGFLLAQDVSAYSLVAVARAVAPAMTEGGSLSTLTYLGATRVVTNYNVMGVAKAALESSVRYLASDLGPKNIRVNAISAGAIKTLASAGISGISTMLQAYREKSPLRRGVDTSEVADAAVFLLSQASRGVTGEILMVDSGFHAMGGA